MHVTDTAPAQAASGAAGQVEGRKRPSTGFHWNPNRRNLVAASGFLTPFLILLVLFQYLPLLAMARNSLYDYTLFNPDAATFVGVDNFVRVFTDRATLTSLVVTLLFMAGLLILVIPAAFLLAVYLNGRLPARALLRTMIFLPVVTSSVVVSVMWMFMLNQSGLINSALASIGVGPIGFLTDPKLALPAIIVMTVWQQVGLATVLFLGGLQAIPAELVEAAQVDGASAARRLWSITLPLLSHSTLLIVVVMTVFGLQAFAPAYIMTSGGPEGTTNLLIFHIYRTAFYLQQPGFASAMTVVLLAIAMTISLIQMRVLKTTWSY